MDGMEVHHSIAGLEPAVIVRISCSDNGEIANTSSLEDAAAV